MAINCPHKKLKAYKDLVAVVGENSATAVWVHYDGLVPDRFYKIAKENLSILTDFIGTTAAESVIAKNNGHTLDKTPTGEDSLMFQELVKLTGSIAEANKIKAQFYLDDYLSQNNWIDRGSEPIEEVEYMMLHQEVLDMYKRNNLETMFKLERLKAGTTAFVNTSKIRVPSRKNVKNSNVRSALAGDPSNKFYISYIDSNTKKYITTKYFRMDDTQPYYPFSMGSIQSNQKRVALINSEFNDGKAVVYNPKKDVIEFSDDVNSLMFTPDKKKFLDEQSTDLDIESLGDAKSRLDADKEMISRYEGLIDVINKTLSEKTGRRESLLARRDRLKEKIDQLKANGTTEIIVRQAEEDINSITSRLNDIDANLYKDLSEEQLWTIMADLQELGAYIRGWDGLSEMLDVWDIELEEVKTKINTVTGTLSTLHTKYLDMIKKSMVKYANIVSYKADFSDKLFDALEDDSMLNRMVFGASMSNSELVKIVDDIIKSAAYKINNETLDKDKELTDWLNKLKKHLGIKDEIKISERFHQLDKNGKWTGAIVSKVSQDYFDKVRELYEKASNNGEWRPYFKFLEDNTHELSEDEFKAYIKRKEQGLPFDIRRISSQKYSNGEYVFTEKDFIKQEALYNKYEQHREEYKKETLAAGNFVDSNGEFISEDIENNFLAIMKDWEMKNNPFYMAPGRLRNPFAEYRIPDKIDSKWFDKKFAQIEKDPVLKEFYDFYRARMLENDQSLPYYKKEQSNLIYSVRKTVAEEFAESRGVAKAASLIKDGAMNLVMAESQSDIEGRAIVGDKVYKNIPVGMLYTSLTGEERSPNIFKALKKHTDVSINYKYKVKVEPIANAAQDIIDTMEAVRGVETEAGRAYMKNKHTYEAHKQKAALFNVRARLQYLLDAHLYGETQEKPDLHGKGKVTSKGDTLKYSGTKIIDSLIKFTYLKALSVPNVISPTVNLAVGIVNNSSYAAGGVDFNDSSLGKAYLKMFSAVSKHLGKSLHIKDFEQVMTWLVRLDVLPDINSAAFEDSASWDKYLTILQSKGEYINQGATMVAYLIHNKLKDKNGKEVSILDAYKTENGNLIWNKELMGEQSEVSSTDIISKDGRAVNLYRLSEKIKGINEYIHGDYGSKLEIKKTAYGRAIALFKTWLPMTISHRFGKERYESRLQRNVKGRYRSFLSATTKDGIDISVKKIIPLLLKGMVSKRAFDVLSDVDKVNLKRNLRELQLLGSLMLLTMMMMKAGDDDDESIKMRSLNILINLASKTQSDLEFYLNPASMSSIANNTVPIIGTLNDMVKVSNAFYETILGNPTYKNGAFNGQNRILVTTGRMFPVTSGIAKMYNYSQQQFNFGSTR